ncbi:hypothetical protein HYPSUDRAFT_280772 [Hypholoma sublateritium FD-334 SS-4]|uniref:Uncharacterized protein n=1 Tax=Hypholoma sublateritium (strain FD-334 SS-4) TaxID=945553 RepID=A0A0D2MRM7_HYPSF|nr:hypothetical protein HYPSUDRAFT_280772 [Hypholoma sublateritium FD-334 SS-4]
MPPPPPPAAPRPLCIYHAAFLGARIRLNTPSHFKSTVLRLALATALCGAVLLPAFFFLVSVAAAQCTAQGKGVGRSAHGVLGTLLPALVWEAVGCAELVWMVEAALWGGHAARARTLSGSSRSTASMSSPRSLRGGRDRALHRGRSATLYVDQYLAFDSKI